MSSKTGRGWCLKNSKIFAKSRIDWGTSGKWKSGHKCDETYHWHEKPKKTAENMNTPPPLPTLKMLKKLFSPKKNPEMVETFPNVMERIVGVRNPKKSQKSKHPPPPLCPPLYMLKSKNFEIIKNYHKWCETFTNVMKRIIGMRNPKKLPKI